MPMDEVNNGLSSSANENLNEQQAKAVTFDGRHLLVLAGAGTGKTRTIIARAKYLLKCGVSPSRILMLSFTRKSAKEIVNRISASLPEGSATVTGQTFHSWCMELIKGNPLIFSFSDYTILDEDDRSSCFSLLCGRHFKKENFISPEELGEVASFMANTRCNLSAALEAKVFHGIDNDKVREEIAAKRPVYAEILKKYHAYKAERHYLDYDDILRVVADGLARNEEARRFVTRQYDHILIDEMQDTNPLQYHLLDSFWPTCHLFCVGDDAQSIYGFRGADFKSIHDFSRRIPGAEVMKLTVNYRSTQRLLDFSNWLLRTSPFNYDKELTADRGEGEMPSVVHFRDEWDEARDVVMRIRDSIGVEGCRYGDNMVLSRSGYGMRAIEACCVEAHIPYKIFGGSQLMQSAHIRDVIAALRIVSNHKDELAWQRYLCLFPGIGEIKAARIISSIIPCDSLEEALKLLSSLPEKRIGEVLQSIMSLQFSVAEAINKAFKGLESILKAKPAYRDNWEKRRQDFDLLERIGLSSESIASFIAEYILDPALETGLKEGASPEDCVTITTIHQAKGLEARNCYILNVNYTVYPSVRAVQSGDDAIEEERRCLYVAMTRARDRLVIYKSIKASRVEESTRTDTVRANSLYFLNNLPLDLYNLEDTGHRGSDWNAYIGKAVDIDSLDPFDYS